MAKIIAAYVAHGRRTIAASRRGAAYPLDAELIRQWQRVFCLLAIAKTLPDDDDPLRLIVIADHSPAVVDGRMLGFHLEQLGVEFHRIDHYWRPHDTITKPEFFVFDVLDYLFSETRDDDQILIFGGKALVVNPLDQLFAELKRETVLFAEASYGEIAEDHERALRDRMKDLRNHYSIDFPNHAICAASTDFIGVSHMQIGSLMTRLRALFMKNFLRSTRNEDHFVSAEELLAALLAQAGFYHSYMTGLSDHAAAMPDDFLVAALTDIPMTIPGYGREPEIQTLFDALIGDRLDHLNVINKDFIDRLLKRDTKTKPLRKIMSSFMPRHR